MLLFTELLESVCLFGWFALLQQFSFKELEGGGVLKVIL